MALPDLSNFEFILALYQNSWDMQRLPDKFAEVLDGQEPHEVQLQEASGGCRRWDVEVFFDSDGHMYLKRCWEEFARVHGLQFGHFLAFTYDGAAALTVKVFDGSICRRHYRTDDEEEDA